LFLREVLTGMLLSGLSFRAESFTFGYHLSIEKETVFFIKPCDYTNILQAISKVQIASKDEARADPPSLVYRAMAGQAKKCSIHGSMGAF